MSKGKISGDRGRIRQVGGALTQIVISWLVLLAVIFGYVFLSPVITGFITTTEMTGYSDNLSWGFDSNGEYLWVPSHLGDIKSVKIDGTVEGNAKVYVEDKGVRYLVFDSDLLDDEGNLITGLAVGNETVEDVVGEENNEPYINETIKEIEINLNYGDGESYDPNNDGIAGLEEVVDLKVDGSFNWDADYSKLCARWEVYSADVSEFVCYGSSECCAFAGLESSSPNWEDSFNIYYGLYGAGADNVVSAQVIYYDIDIDSLEAEVYSSSLDSLDVKFIDEIAEFNDACVDTCLVDFDDSSYKLIVETDGSLFIGSIDYIVEQEVLNNPPILVKAIENFTVSGEFSIDLSQYFADEDGDVLSYSSYEVDDLYVSLEGDAAKILPAEGFTGVKYLFFKANDSEAAAVSNVFKIEVVEGMDTVVGRVKVGEDVKWKKNVKFDSLQNGIVVNLTEDAKDIIVRKVENGVGYAISDVKVRENGKIKDLVDYEGKNSGIASVSAIEEVDEIELIIEEAADELEIEYSTPGPTSVEERIGGKKRVTVSSEIHYEDILAYSYLDNEVKESGIKLFWLNNGERELIEFISKDTNGNGLIDYIEWTVPSLSEQVYEIEITVLNVQSYPVVGGEWEVRFETIGAGNLTISTIDTSWSDVNEDGDLKFLGVRCGEDVKEYEWIENKVFIEDYSCNSTGYETSKVLTTGVHQLMFMFGGEVGYANNTAVNVSGPMYFSVDDNVTRETGFAHLNTTNDLVFYMPFDVENSSDSITYDYTLNNNDGNVFNAQWTADGWAGTGCYYFDGLDVDNNYDNVIWVPNAVKDTLPNSSDEHISVFAWVKTQEESGSKIQTVVDNRYVTAAGGNGIQMRLRYGESLFTFNSGQYSGENFLDWYPSDSWHQIGFTHNGSNVTMYFDGQVDRILGNETPYWANNSNQLTIGGRKSGVAIAQSFNGTIDEVRIYNRSLNNEEVLALYNNQTATFMPTGEQRFVVNFTEGHDRVNITINETQTYFDSNLSIQINNRDIVNISSGRFIGYNFTGGTKNANVTLRYSAGTDNFSSPMVIGNITVDGWNEPPVVDSILLNATSKNNVSADNLTVNYTITEVSGSSKGIVNWYRNGSSIMVLNMPFENNGSSDLEDYSGNSNHGTATGAIWNASGGYDSKGAYKFDGSGDYITPGTNVLFDSTKPFTATAWINVKSAAYTLLYPTFLSLKTDQATGLIWFYTDTAGYAGINVGSNANFMRVRTVDALSGIKGKWTHVALVYDGVSRTTNTSYQIYVNGTLQSWQSTGAFGTVTNANSIGNGESYSGDFNGYIDEVKMYTTNLSASQIKALYENRTDLIVAEETTAGENWTACVTPNDGYEDGVEVCSNNLTILNTVPTVDSILLNATSGGNYTEDNLTLNYTTSDVDGDSIKAIVNWKRNGSSISVINLPFENEGGNYLKDYSGNGLDATNSNAVWGATEGYDGRGAYQFSGVNQRLYQNSISNTGTGPVSFSLWIKPMGATGTYQVLAQYGDNAANVVLDLATSADGTNFGCSQWGNNYNVPFNYGQWYYVVCAYNTSHILTYVDGIMRQNISASINIAASILSLGAADNLAYDYNGTIDDFIIFNRSLSQEQILAIYHNRTNLIVSQETLIGENWTACVTPNDGYEDGVEVCSKGLFVMKNASVDTWDDTDTTPKIALEKVMFYVNYTDSDGITVPNSTGVYCDISFNISGGAWEDNANMSYNLTSTLWEYNRTFDSKGVYDYYVVCDGTVAGFDSVVISESSTINNTAPVTQTPWVLSHEPVNISDGMVGYWKLEGNAIDDALGNNGSVVGARPVEDGAVGRAYGFDGVDDYIDMPLEIIPPYNMTLSAWLYVNSEDGGARLLGSDDSLGSNYELRTYSNSDGGYFALLYPNSTYGMTYSSIVPFYYNQWYHVAFTAEYNGTGNNTILKAYYNGIQDDYDVMAGTYMLPDTSIWFGRWNTGYLNGTIDEVIIWNKTLSADEVRQVYERTNHTDNEWNVYVNDDISVSSNSSSDQDIGDNVTGIVNWYKNGESITVLNMPFEKHNSTANGMHDYSGYVRDITEVGGPVWNATGGYDGKGAYEFDGNKTFIRVVLPNIHNFTQITLSAWVSNNDISDDSIRTIFGPSSIFYIDSTSGSLRMYTSSLSDTSMACAGAFTDNKFHHIVATFNNITEEKVLYFDGEECAKESGVTGGIIISSFAIGRISVNGDDRYWNGSIDNFVLYNHSLSPAQIKALYENRTSTIVSEELEGGDKWSACITPNDGFNDGTTICSNNITIHETVNALDTWDDTDTTPKLALEKVMFYVNYTDEDNLPVTNRTGVYCDISFNISGGAWEANANMSYNSTSTLWEYNRTFSTKGTYPYYVLCDGTVAGFDSVVISESAGINNTAPTSSTPWILSHEPVNISDGMVGYWKLEGNAIDDALGNNGTVVDARAVEDGAVGRAYGFDGVDDYIDVPYSQDLNLTKEVTVSAWIYAKDAGENGYARPFSKYSAFEVYMGPDGAVSFRIYNETSSKNPYVADCAPFNEWHFITLVYNGSHIIPYCDAVKDPQGNDIDELGGTIRDNDGGLMIGDYPPHNRHFNGSVDEVMIWNRTLSDSEITSIYERTNHTSNEWNVYVNDDISVSSNSSSDQDEGDNVTGIVNWYKNGDSITILNMPFEKHNETANGTKDYSGYGNDGSEVSGPTWNATGGYNGKGAYEFDGVNDNIRSNNFLINSTSLTSCFWIKPLDDHVDELITHRAESGSDKNFEIYKNGASISLRGNGTTLLNVGGILTLNKWTHVCGVIEDNIGKIYSDGVFRNQGTINPPDRLTYKLTIGTWPDGTSYPFNGTIDEVMIFNHTLSAEQIKALYENRTSTIVSEELEGGDKWSACITPNDGFNDGTTICSNNITIHETVNALDTWDDTDTTPKLALEKVMFYVNYTDEDNLPVVNLTGVTCDISFNISGGDWEDHGNMSYNSTSTLWQYNRTFSTKGTYPYYVICDGTIAGFDSVTISESSFVNNSIPVVNLTNITTDKADFYPTSTLIGWCNATDTDGENLTYYYQWYKDLEANDSGYYAPRNFSSGELVNIANISPIYLNYGENWTFSCAASDNESNSTWSNHSVLIANPFQLVYPANGTVLERITSPTVNFTVANLSESMNITLYNVTDSGSVALAVFSESEPGSFNYTWQNMTAGKAYNITVEANTSERTVSSPIYTFTPNDAPKVINMRAEQINQSSILFKWQNEPDMEWISLRIGNDIIEVRSITGTDDNWTVSNVYQNQEYLFEFQTGDSLRAMGDYTNFSLRTLGWNPSLTNYQYRRLITIDHNLIGSDKNDYAVNISLNETNFQYYDSDNWVWYTEFTRINWTNANDIRFTDYYDVEQIKYNVTYKNIGGDGGVSYQTAPDETGYSGNFADFDYSHDANWNTQATPNLTGTYYYNYSIPAGAKTSSKFRIYDGNWGWDLSLPEACFGGTKLQFRSDANYSKPSVNTYCFNSSDEWEFVRNNGDNSAYIYETMMTWEYSCMLDVTVMPKHFNYDNQSNIDGIDGDYDTKLWMYYGYSAAEDNTSTISPAGIEQLVYTIGDVSDRGDLTPSISGLDDTEGRTSTGTNISWIVDISTDNRVRYATNEWLLVSTWASRAVNMTESFNHQYGDSDNTVLLTVYPGENLTAITVNCTNSSYIEDYTINASKSPIEVTFLDVNDTSYLNWTVSYVINKSYERNTRTPEFMLTGLEPDTTYYYEANAYGTNGNGTAAGNFTLGTLPSTPSVYILNYTEDRPGKTITICTNITDLNGNSEVNASFQFWTSESEVFNETSADVMSSTGVYCKDISVEYGTSDYYRAKIEGETTGYSERYANEFMAIQEFFAGSYVDDDGDDRERQYCPNGVGTTPCYDQKGYLEGSQQREDWIWIETNLTGTLTVKWLDGTWNDYPMTKDDDSEMRYVKITGLGDSWQTFYIVNSSEGVVLNWTKPSLTHLANHNRTDEAKYVSFGAVPQAVNYTLLYMNPMLVYNTSAYEYCIEAGGDLYTCMAVEYWGGGSESGIGENYAGTAYDRGQLFRGGIPNGEPYDTGTLEYERASDLNMGEERHCYAFTVYWINESILPSTNITNYYYRYWTSDQWYSTYLGYPQDRSFDFTGIFEWAYDLLSYTRDWSTITSTKSLTENAVLNATNSVFKSAYNQSLLVGSKSGFNVDITSNDDEIYDIGFFTDGLWTNQQLGKYQQGFVIFNLPSDEALQGMDSDSDGLNDYDELYTYYLNPKSNDTDEDGRADGWEITQGYNANLYTSYNTAPVTAAAVLNASSGTNYTNENLSVNYTLTDYDGDDVEGIVNWKKDGSSFMVLNMPFEGGSKQGNVSGVPDGARDYALGNNGTVVNATWNSTGGYDGRGAYELYGANDYIRLSKNIFTNYNDNFTMSLWVKPRNAQDRWTGTVNFISMQGRTMLRYQLGDIRFILGSSVGGWHSLSADYDIDLEKDRWYHVVGSFNSNWTGNLYVDGVLIDNVTTDWEPLTSYLTTIGIERSGVLYPFNGTIDDVRIYNYSLSAEQILALYENKTNLIVEQETTKNEVWQACVTPNDGYADGTEVCSNNLTIRNSLPTFDEAPAGQQAYSDIEFFYDLNASDIDSDTLVYYLNDTSIFSVNAGNGTVSGTPTEAQKGVYSFNITAGDGEENISSVFAITVNDITLPNITSIDQPENNTNLSTRIIQFNFTAEDANPGDAVLYLNGRRNISFSNWTSGAKNNFSGISLADGYYNWTVKVNDTSDNNYTYPGNYTFLLDATPPSISSEKNISEDATFYSDKSVKMNATITDAHLSDVLFSYNLTGNWTNITSESNTSEYNYTLAAENLTAGNTYYWRFYANDTFGNIKEGDLQSFTITARPAPEEPTSAAAAEGGGGGGGGGGPAKPSGAAPSVSFSKNAFDEIIVIGDSATRTLIIKNTGTDVLEGTIVMQGLKGYAFISDSSFSIAPGQEFAVNIDIIAKGLGTFKGRLIITVGGTVKTIPITIDVEKEAVLFDAKIDIPLGYATVYLGEELTTQITLQSMGLPKKVDVFIDYIIQDETGHVVFKETDTMAVDKQLTFTKAFKLPDGLAPGDYMINIEVSYAGAIAVAGEMFTVAGKEMPLLSPARFARVGFAPIIAVLAVITILMVIAGIVMNRSSKINVKKKRYK